MNVSKEAVDAAMLAYGEARMRFQTGANDPLGPIIALAAKDAEIERLQCDLRLAISARDYANDMLEKERGSPAPAPAEAMRGETLVSQIFDKGPPHPWEPEEGDIRVGKLADPVEEEAVSYLNWWLGLGQYDEGSKLATSISYVLAALTGKG